MVDDDNSETNLSNLLCKEDGSCFNEQYKQKDVIFEFCSVSEGDCEYIEMLMERETDFKSNGSDTLVKNETNWLKCARLDAVKWILKTRALFGFQFHTAYLSMIYFDRFFSRRSIDDEKLWTIRLLSVACLSVAAKMEEIEVPALSEYHVHEYNFEGNVIQKMELLILNTLGWTMNYATPFAYLNYFITKFYVGFGYKELLTRAGELILAVMEEINVVEHRPSIIAAAAILAANDHQLTEKTLEIKMNVIPSWGSLEQEYTSSCYNLMKRIIILKSKTPDYVISANPLTHSSSIDTLDDSTITFANGAKRRLTYVDGYKHSPPKKIPKS